MQRVVVPRKRLDSKMRERRRQVVSSTKGMRRKKGSREARFDRYSRGKLKSWIGKKGWNRQRHPFGCTRRSWRDTSDGENDVGDRGRRGGKRKDAPCRKAPPHRELVSWKDLKAAHKKDDTKKKKSLMTDKERGDIGGGRARGEKTHGQIGSLSKRGKGFWRRSVLTDLRKEGSRRRGP